MNENNILDDPKIIRATGLLIFIIYCFGLFIPLMDYDSGHHAGIALHMYLTGNYVFLIDNGEPYLDKPHLLFWLTAFSYKLCGVTSFAYRLPSFLFSLLAIYSTYRLGKQLYNSSVGILAALILSTAFAYAVSIYDVRMEGLLTGSVIFSTWQLISYAQDKKTVHLVLAALGLAAGFSTKGMIGLAIPVIALLIHIIYTRQWQLLFDPKWLIVVVLFALFISPVVYCYYLQFNLHPETAVKGQNNISGTRFILWNQSLKRMSGESHGVNQSDFFFFFHTFLWAFLPWSILCVYSIAARIKILIKEKFRSVTLTEAVSAGTAIFFLLLFSFSKFKLPHYLNCLFPFFSILLAGYLVEKREDQKVQRLNRTTQLIVVSTAVALGFVLSVWAFPVPVLWKMIVLLLLFILWISSLFIKADLFNKYLVVTTSGFVFLLASLFINFYPELLKYQAGNQLACYAKNEKIQPEKIFYLTGDIHSPSFDFYTAWLHRALSLKDINDSTQRKKPLWLYTSGKGLDSIQSAKIHTGTIISNPDFRVSVLTLPFINPATRNKAVKQTYLIEVL